MKKSVGRALLVPGESRTVNEPAPPVKGKRGLERRPASGLVTEAADFANPVWAALARCALLPAPIATVLQRKQRGERRQPGYGVSNVSGRRSALSDRPFGALEGEVANEPRILVGTCLCGRTAYEVADTFEYAMNCHCSQCRRTTGSAFKPLAGTKASHLMLTKGDGELLRYGDEQGHDAHCRACGSLLYSLVRDGEYVHVALGTLVDAPSIRPSMHIFVGSKAPWFEITDALPQFDEFPDHG